MCIVDTICMQMHFADRGSVMTLMDESCLGWNVAWLTSEWLQQEVTREPSFWIFDEGSLSKCGR